MVKKLEKVEVYPTPQGGYESTIERAIAWHIVKLLKYPEGKERVSFTDALAIVEKRQEVRALLDQIDGILD